MNKADYPPNWGVLSKQVREEAGWKCEGSPHFPDCRAEHMQPHPITGSKVVLTVAHMDHDLTNNERDNLRSLCQRCHLTHDAKQHARSRGRNRREDEIDAGQMELPGL